VGGDGDWAMVAVFSEYPEVTVFTDEDSFVIEDGIYDNGCDTDTLAGT
jgi:hypothetical protein